MMMKLRLFFSVILLLAAIYSNAQKKAKRMDAPEIIQPDMNGIPFDVATLRGKVVLVEFWASWCGPCRRENPHLKKAYEEFRDKNFEIVSISLDTDARRWKWAVEKDEMNWINLGDLRGPENELANKLGIRSIPFNFLIDQQGKVVAFDLRGKELSKQLSKMLD